MSGRRPDVLRVLQESSGPLSIGEIARRLGLHVNTARFHLEALAETGQVERLPTEPAGPGRPPLMFRAHQGMDPAGPRNYRFLADMLTAQLADAPDPATAAVEIGRRWGLRAAVPPVSPLTAEQAVAWLVRVLDELGFVPRAEGGEISLRNCPFLDVVEPHNRVACDLHLGYLRGAVEGAGDPLAITGLIPFDRPDRCTVTYRTGSR